VPNPPRTRLAPVADAVVIVLFVVFGRRRHDIDEGVSWFLTVLWPLLVGWFGVAVLVRLYVREAGIWTALTVTWIGGLAVMCVLRGTFTDRPYVGIFTVIAIGFIGALTFGWRAVAALVARRRAATASV
jgi:hypothetical protein